MPEEGEKLATKIATPSEDPEHDPTKDKDMFAGRFTDHESTTLQILTEEDKKLKETLELLVSRVQEPAPETKEAEELLRQTLEALRKEIRSSTSSMTSVPKPLKFMRPHYGPLCRHYKTMPASDNKKLLADILSVLAMTMADEKSRDSLHFKLEGHTEELESWGHEYVRHLTTDVMSAYKELSEKDESVDHLLKIVSVIVPFNIKQNAPIDAIDLLTEVDHLSDLVPHIDADNYQRICYYLTSSAQTLNDSEEIAAVLETAYQGYKKANDLPQALRVAIRMDSQDKIVECFQAAKEDKPLSLQLGYILGSQKGHLSPDDVDGDEDILNAVGNVSLNAHYLQLAKELDVLAPKTPEDIYKSHLVEGVSRHRGAAALAGPTVDSAKQNLASTFVNAFVNAGFGKDTLVTPEGADWVFKNKAHGMLSAAASVGMVMLWDVETGFSAADKFTFSSQNMVKAGAQLATGILASGITSEMDAVHGLLSEHLEAADVDMRISAIMGLGIAYAGTGREDVLESLVPLIVDNNQPMEVVAMTCLALGFIFVGTGHDDISGSILEGFLDRSETDLNDSVSRMMCLGMGLLYLGRGENCEGVLMAVKAIEHPIHQYLEATIETCAYVGSGNVLQIQKLLSMLNTHIEDDEKAPLKGIHQEIAVLGIAMIAMGETIGSEMSLRMLDHVLQYGEVNVRRVVPLALGLLSVSNPRLAVMDTISKLSHDADEQVSQNACLALGFLGAGTNNSRIANILRQLAAYYDKEPNHLFLVRIAQGLLHFGKGLVTLNPFHSDNFLMNKVAMAGLLAVFHSAFDLKNSILNKRHYLLYTLATAVRPRCLITVDEEGKSLPVTVRVGQAVDVVAQVGNPKTITGFQTHTTPVLLAAGDRVELGTDQYIALSSVLEGVVVLKKNPKATPSAGSKA